jgi:hypothetical protein
MSPRYAYWIVALGAAAVVGCSHGSSQESTATTSGSSPANSSSTANSSSAVAANGGSSAAPTELNSPQSAASPVATPEQTTFNVTWNPQTKVIDAATVSQAYRGVAQDGSLTFDAASAPAIAALTPGTVTVFSGLALRKIVSVRSDGNQLHVVTAPAALNEAISDGQIAWKYNVNFANLAYVTPPGFHRVDVADDPNTWIDRLLASPALADAPVHYNGSIQDWDIDMKLTPNGDNLEMELTADKRHGGGLLEVKATGELDSLTNSVNIDLANGQTKRIGISDGNLHGKFDLTWSVTFDKDHGGDDKEIFNEAAVIKLPLGFRIPFFVGPLPFELNIKTGFSFSPAFTSKTTVAQGSYHASFGGDVAVNDATSGGGAQSTMDSDGGLDSYGGTLSVAPLGLSLTVMMPKIEIKLGAPEELETILGETSGDAFVALFIQANFVATGPVAIAPCERRELNVSGMYGYDAGLLGIGIASYNHQIFKRTRTYVIPSNIRLCQTS